MADEDYKVYDSHKRLVFEGPEKAARQYVERNYPRPHAEIGLPVTYSATLHSPDGEKEYFHVDEGWNEVQEDENA